jgi:hypothetical protein
MNRAKLIKMIPTLVMVIFLAYSSYAMQGSLPGSAGERAELEKGLDIMVRELVASGTATAERLGDGMRDPFQVIKPRQAAAQGPALPDAAPQSGPDPVADIVHGLRLDATLIRGHEQVAVIDGKIYSQGQRLRLERSGGEPPPTLVLVSVFPTRVVLRGDSRSYVLGYPDQLGSRKDDPEKARTAEMSEIDQGGQVALFQKLLKSPLGALGKSVLGKSAETKPRHRTRPAN